MDKPKIDDAMVMRFLNAHDATWCTAFDGDERKARVRLALEAALNPPPEIEIAVSEGMKLAAIQWFADNNVGNLITQENIASIYICMERCRIKESTKRLNTKHESFGFHRRTDDISKMNFRHVRNKRAVPEPAYPVNFKVINPVLHRRATDPTGNFSHWRGDGRRRVMICGGNGIKYHVRSTDSPSKQAREHRRKDDPR